MCLILPESSGPVRDHAAAFEAAVNEALADAVVALLAAKREELRRGSHREAGATASDGSIEGDAA